MAYSEDFRRAAVKAYNNGKGSYDAVSKLLGIAKGTLVGWVHRERLGQGLQQRPRSGRPSKFSSEHESYLFQLVEQKKDWTQSELATQMNKQFPGLDCNRHTVGRALQRLTITRKKNMEG